MIGLLSLLLVGHANADVTLASVFTDHAVLQQGKTCPVFGFADAGEKVTVNFNGQTQESVADASGKWLINLADIKAGGPFVLSVSGKNKVELTDIYVGEVWLCSGQSNMDFTVAKTPKYYFAGVNNEAAEVAAANYPLIRMFKGDTQKSISPQTVAPGAWKVCTPENVKEFSAVGYFFARDLQKELNVPIGIVCQTFGASTAESWMRREVLMQFPDMKERTEKLDTDYKAVTDEQRKKFQADLKAWQVEADKATAEGKRAPRGPRDPDPSQDQHQPTVMYNGMIAPIIPYGIRGVLWYQGESVVGGSAGVRGYGAVQKALVNDWRTLWNNPELPFYNVQLASLNGKSNGAEIRAQQATILDLPHTGMAITIDIGDETNVHPKNKQDVGKRLCLIALANTYDKKIEFSGPVVDKVILDNDTLRITFTHAEGLTAKGATDGVTLNGFEIARKDGKFVSATAKIVDGAVVVQSPDVKDPTTVRYAWKGWANDCNLFNKSDLPAAPFNVSVGK